jgi:hypothetical protein
MPPTPSTKHQGVPPKIAHKVRGLRFTQFKSLCVTMSKRILQESLTALAAQVESFFSIVFGSQKLAVGVEFVIALEDLFEILQVVAIFVHRDFVGARRRINFHVYHVAHFMLRIELTVAQVANVSNHLATILS